MNFREPSLGLDWMYHSVEQKYAFQRIRDKVNLLNLNEGAYACGFNAFTSIVSVNPNEQRFQKAHMGGGKGIGGSSHINFQIYSRGWDENYDRWERVYGATGWNSSEMLHFMKQHENVHGEPSLESGSFRCRELPVICLEVPQFATSTEEILLHRSTRKRRRAFGYDQSFGRTSETPR